MNLFGNTFNTLERSLNYATTKNNLISENISNKDTPNYKAKEVTFNNLLSNELSKQIEAKRTHADHRPFGNNSDGPFQIKTKNNTTYNHNGNNVDVDKEMAELAKNQIYYQGLVDRMNGKFNKIQTVIRGGS